VSRRARRPLCGVPCAIGRHICDEINLNLLANIYVCVCCEETGFAMFSTEQGASPDKLTREASRSADKDAAGGDGKDAAPAIASRQVSFRAGSESAGGGATEERAGEESLLAVSPLKRLKKQKTVVKKTPPEQLRALWRKAIKEVVNTNRVRKLGYGLSSTRVKKSQSVYERLQRMEEQLFHLPITLMDTFDRGLAESEYLMTKELKKLDESLERSHELSMEAVAAVGGAVTEVRGSLKELDSALHSLSSLVEERTASQASQQAALDELAVKVTEAETGHARAIRKRMRGLMAQLQKITHSFDTVQGEVYSLMAKQSIAAESSADDAIVLMLKVDAQLRQSREAVVSLEGDCSTLSSMVITLKEEIAAARRGANSKIPADDHTDLHEACEYILKAIDQIVVKTREAQNFCKKHDDQIADRWITFAGVIQAAKSTTKLSSQIKVLQVELEDKPSRANLQEAVSGAVVDTGPLVKEIEDLRAQVLQQAAQMDDIKAQMQAVLDAQQQQPSGVRGSASGSRPITPGQQSLPAASKPATPANGGGLAVLPPISGRGSHAQELDASLQPMIQAIVDTYLKNWLEANRLALGDDQSAPWQDSQGDDDSWYQRSVNDGQGAAGEEEGAGGAGAPGDQQPQEEFEDQETGDIQYFNVEEPVEGGGEAAAGATVTSVEIGEYPRLEDYLEPAASSAPADPSAPASARANSPPPRSPAPSSGRQAAPSAATATAAATAAAGVPPRPKAAAAAPVVPVAAAAKQPQRQPQSSIVPVVPSGAAAARPTQAGGGSRPPSRSRQDTTSSENATQPPSSRPSGAGLGAAAASSSSGPMRRGDSGRRADAAVMQKIRDEMKHITDKIESMYLSKMDSQTAESLLRVKADAQAVEQKADVKVVEAIEETLQKVAAEMGDLKSMQASVVVETKKEMAKKLDEALKKLLFAERASSRGVSLAATKSLCLSCGRESHMKDNAVPSSPRGMLPSLTSGATPGPDVYRGGFKLPVSSAPSTQYGLLKKPKNSTSPPTSPLRPSTSAVDLPYKKMNNKDPILFSRSLGTVEFTSEDVQNAVFDDDDSQGSRKMIRPVPELPIVQGLSGDILNPNEIVRPMYRKGFPAKKTNRPPVISIVA
jgi:hypothetical protein